jgi:molybdenum cofactor synthesis domain-containing protein
MQKITAAILIIGNEILSGRTQDSNTQYIATKLSERGIHLQEVRVIPDSKQVIIEHVNDLRTKYTYLFTTGGIGPTHDDITSDAIATAFGTALIKHPEAHRRLEEYYTNKGSVISEANTKMAYIPEVADLIDNSASAAPGFIIYNVYVMAGVPYIMQAMMDFVLPKLATSDKIESRSISMLIGESLIAKEMEAIENKYLDLSVGSYPFIQDGHPATSIVMRSSNIETLEKAFKEFTEMIKVLGII